MRLQGTIIQPAGAPYFKGVTLWQFTQTTESSLTTYALGPTVLDTKNVTTLDAGRLEIYFYFFAQLRENINGTYARLDLEYSDDGGITYYGLAGADLTETGNTYLWKSTISSDELTLLAGNTVMPFRLVGYHLGCTIDGKAQNIYLRATIFHH